MPTRLGLGLRLSDILVTRSTLLNNLVSYWTMDETSGTRYDAVGSKHLTDNNTVGYRAGINKNAALFVAAQTEYLSRDDYQVTADNGSFTVSLWYYFANAAANRAQGLFDVSHSWDALTTQVSIYNGVVDGTSLTVLISDGAGSYKTALSNRSLTAGWHHVVAWYDSSDRKIRESLDGNAPAGGEISDALAGVTRYTTAEPLWIGRHTAGTVAYMEGAVDEVGVWSRVLTTAERASLYTGGIGRFWTF